MTISLDEVSRHWIGIWIYDGMEVPPTEDGDLVLSALLNSARAFRTFEIPFPYLAFPELVYFNPFVVVFVLVEQQQH